ncbi:NAD(P)H-dependent oxidoreductase [Nocardioides carbamazepini]|uniref:NAD(P)H-dependent oxidoreductase n=1 Tax=Nocardioides carbamazepini TaxID=2854259 RepID=UPI00214A6F09|nr:NAD(P)H-dependent oxidoreductase [Nocardioides carbamazepini]MCR1785851.1 NAD(P)H-dependent oxidoreductase [Nocardioides carbamazepini]
MRAVVVVGNPKRGSRTRAAAEMLAGGLGATNREVIELADLGSGLLGWGDAAVAAAVRSVQASDLVVFASPTFKATYTGLLKLFLDQFAGQTGLAGQVAVPLMLGAGRDHALAPELSLKPVLVELGAVCPTAALYQLDSTFDTDDSRAVWLSRWAPVVRRLLQEVSA